MTTATLVDFDALWHLTLYATGAALGLVVAFGMIAVARTRLAEGGGWRQRAPWLFVTGFGSVFCVGLVALGLWAMTQK